MAEEIKAGFTVSYAGLFILVSGVSVVLGFWLRYLLGRFVKKRRSVKVITRPSENLLNVKEILGGGIKGKFYLPSNHAKDIKSYFQYTVSVLNDGDLGIDDFTLSIKAGEDISLVKEPTIRTDPEKIRPAIKLSQQEKPEPFIDEWTVGLLNSHELLEFTYVGYSEVAIAQTSELEVVLRKKNLMPQYISGLTQRAEEDTTTRAITWPLSIALMIVMASTLLAVVIMTNTMNEKIQQLYYQLDRVYYEVYELRERNEVR